MLDFSHIFYRFSAMISGRVIIVPVMCAVLNACTSLLPDAHKLEITQGNVITPEQVESITAGMPKAEVRAVLGVPVLQDPFHNQRWDYIFRYSPGGKGPVKQSRFTVFFDDDIVVRSDDSEYVDPEDILPPPSLEE